jgi:2-furoate---CoA ligase
MTMTPALIEHCLEALRPELFVNYYGSSEIYTFTFSDRQNRKPGSAGRPGLNQSIRVVPADSEGRAVHDEVLAAGQPGEIIASMASPEAFKGYWRLPEADAKAIRDGWYYTGDLGQWDKDGELTIMGRVDDMIISGAENIYPEEVEDVAVRSGLAADVAVIGMADARLGQRVVAFVEPAMVGLDAQALDQAYLASPLPRFKRPREYVFVKRMPRSASGKLLRRLLREGEYEALSDD